MLTTLISGFSLYKPQMIAAQTATTGNTADLANALKKAVESLGYLDETCQAFTNETMSWKDAYGKQLMKGWKETLDKARNEYKAGKLGLPDLVNIETKIISELGNKIKKEFSYDEQSMSLGQVLSSRRAMCETYTEMVYALASALRFPVQGVEVTKMLILNSSTNDHVVSIVGMADNRAILVDLAPDTPIISAPFSIESRFEKDVNNLALKSGAKVKDNISYYLRIRVLDLNGLMACRYGNRGNAYSESGKYQQAITDLNKAISLDPKSALAYNGRGSYFNISRQYEQAIADYNTAIDLDAKFGLAYSNRANAYNNLGRFDLALADCNMAIDLNPKHAAAYSNRGCAYSGLHKYQNAIDDFTMAINYNPKDASSYFQRGNAHINLGYNNKDIAQIQMGVEDLQKAGQLKSSLLPVIEKIFNILKRDGIINY